MTFDSPSQETEFCFKTVSEFVGTQKAFCNRKCSGNSYGRHSVHANRALVASIPENSSFFHLFLERKKSWFYESRQRKSNTCSSLALPLAIRSFIFLSLLFGGLVQAEESGCWSYADDCIQCKRVYHESIMKIRIEIYCSSQCSAADIMYLQKQGEDFITRTGKPLEAVAGQDDRQISEDNSVILYSVLAGTVKVICLYLVKASLPIFLTRFRSKMPQFRDDAERTRDPDSVNSNSRINASQEYNKDFCTRNIQTRICPKEKTEDEKGLKELSKYSGRSDTILETVFVFEERESTAKLRQGMDSLNISGASAGSVIESESSKNTDLKQSTGEEPQIQTSKTDEIPASNAISQSHKPSEGKAKKKAVSSQTHGSLQGGTKIDKMFSKQHETTNAQNSPNSSLEDRKQETEMSMMSLEDTDSPLSLSHSACPIEPEEDVVSSELESNYKYETGENDSYCPNKRLALYEAQKRRIEMKTRSFHMVCYEPPYITVKVDKEKFHMVNSKRRHLVKYLTNTFTKGSDCSERGLDSNNDDCKFLREIAWLPLSQLPVPSIDITLALVLSPAQKILERIAKGETVGAHESMRYEILRVCTFRHYPGEGKPFRILLASAGFYYASEGDEVICYCCGLRRPGWTEFDQPLKIHEQMKPLCNYIVRNQDVNVAVPDLPAENVAKFRMLDEIENLSDAAAAGNSQRSRKTGDLDTAENLQYRVYTPPPKHPQYAELSVRLESFKNWPTNIPQTAQIMADCGYYYAGFGDCVRCFHCGIGLRHWTEDDHPWIEHARWSKDCAYLRERKGEEFIQNVHLAIDDEEEPEDLIPATPNGQPAGMNQVTPNEESSQILLTDPAQSVLEMGYQPRIIKKAIDIILHNEGRSGIRAQKIMETVFMLEERESTANLQQGMDSMNISGASAGSVMHSQSSRNTDWKQSSAEEPNSQTRKTDKIPASDAVSQSHKSSEDKAKGKAVSGQTHGSLQGGTDVDKVISKQHETANALNSPNSLLEDRKEGAASGTSKPRDTTKIKDENKRLKEQTVCKICLDKPVAIVFLPCGHLVTCAECAPAMRKCPICRALVKGSVKAFMS